MSWRTTTLGILTIASALVAAARLLLDSDPATNPDFTSLAATIAAGWGLITARDHKVTSREAGL